MPGKVLLIAYYYPPVQTIGSLRPRGLAKYLPEFGWDVIVLTRFIEQRGRGPEYALVQTDYQDIVAEWKKRFGLDARRPLQRQLALTAKTTSRSILSRMMSLATDVLTFPDPTKGWKRFAVEKGEFIAREYAPDAIISTALPVTCHLIGAKLQKMLDVPWIADYRDLWTNNCFQRNLNLFHNLIERRTIPAASALVTVSAPLAELLGTIHPGKPTYTIANGFDPDDFPSVPVTLDREFSIIHTGYLYEGRRDPTVLLKIVKELLTEGAVARDDLRIRFYGPPSPALQAKIRSWGIEDVAQFPGIVDRDEALLRQRQSQLLLLLGWSGPDGEGVVPGKVFEYLNARRPILLLGGSEGTVSNIVKETHAGVFPTSDGELRKYVLDAYTEFKRQGYITYQGVNDAIECYSQRRMAREFADLLDRVTAQRRKSAGGNNRRLTPEKLPVEPVFRS